MALETELKKLNNHLGELIPVLTALAAGRPATVVDDEEVNEPAEEEETTVVEEPEEEAAVAEEKPVKRKRAKPPAITLDMIRDAVRAYTAAHGPDEGRALLKEKGGVNKLSELDEVDYPAVYEAFLIKGGRVSGVNNCKACIHRSEKKYANGTTDCGPQRVSLGYVCGAFSRGQAPLAAAGVLRRIKEAMRK